MVEHIGGDYSHYQQFPHEEKPSPESHGSGSRLFEEASLLFFRFMSKDAFSNPDNTTLECLSKIMQLAKVSAESGQFIPSRVEQSIVEEISELSDALFDGRIKRSELSGSLMSCLNRLAETSPKAKIVLAVFDLERSVCQGDSHEDEKEGVVKQCQRIYEQMNTEIPNFNLQAFHQEFAHLDKGQHISTLEKSLSELVDRWLF